MPLADRVLGFSDDFSGYEDGSLLQDEVIYTVPEGATSPIIYNDGNVAVIYPQPPPSVRSGALIAGQFPPDQWAQFQVDVVTSGPVADGNGAAALLRFLYSGGEYVYYEARVNGTDNLVQIIKVDTTQGPTQTLASVSHTPASTDVFTFEVISDGGGGCDLTVYDKNESVITTVNDPLEIIAESVGYIVEYASGYSPATVVGINAGYLDTDAARSITGVNGDDIIRSEGLISIAGSGLSEVTGATLSEAGARPYTLTIATIGATQLSCDPVDILLTQLPLGTLRLTLEHPSGDLTYDITMHPKDGWQYSDVTSPTGNYMDKDLGAADGDQIAMPITIGFSTASLQADADAAYDPAVNQLSTHDRHFFDASTNTWDSGPVIVNQVEEGVEVLPPSWRSTPAPPMARVGVPYRYEIGYLIDGSRPITLSQSPGSTALPFGLSYNSSSYPETIEGTITGGSGTIIIENIITRAENIA